MVAGLTIAENVSVTVRNLDFHCFRYPFVSLG